MHKLIKRTLPLSLTATTVKAEIGGVCKEAGTRTTVGKTKLVCTKVKGKTVWAKG